MQLRICGLCDGKYVICNSPLQSQKIIGDLYENTVKFYTYKWISTKGIDQEKLFEYLPSSLLGDISTIIYAELIANVHLSIIFYVLDNFMTEVDTM